MLPLDALKQPPTSLQIQSNNARSLGQDLTSGGQPLARDGDEGTAEFSSVPIVARRVRPAAGDGRGAESLSRLPLFDMHFEVNPKDPEYDSRVYLDVDQVKEKWLAANCAGVICVPYVSAVGLG